MTLAIVTPSLASRTAIYSDLATIISIVSA